MVVGSNPIGLAKKEREIVKLLERLINVQGVSGNEEEVRKIIIGEIKPLVNDVRIDSSGNVIAHKEGREPNFMLAAHMDEIGLMVREITSSGLLLCASIGGVTAVGAIGMRVTVEGAKEKIHGIVTTRDISCANDFEDLPEVDDLIVDTGLNAEKLKKLGVTVGAFVEPSKETNWLSYGNTISGKAIDDRVGCYCLIEIARKLSKVEQEVHYVFTVQEEVGMQGAKTSAFAIHPRWALVIDATPANDLSEEAEKSTGTHLILGNGPCLLHMDEGFIPNTDLVSAIQKTAKKFKIAIQHEVSSFGTTDASNISTVRRGVPSATISIPTRNVHTPIEIANRKDVDSAIKLVYELLRKPPASLRKKATSRKKKSKTRKKTTKKKTGKKIRAKKKKRRS